MPFPAGGTAGWRDEAPSSIMSETSTGACPQLVRTFHDSAISNTTAITDTSLESTFNRQHAQVSRSNTAQIPISTNALVPVPQTSHPAGHRLPHRYLPLPKHHQHPPNILHQEAAIRPTPTSHRAHVTGH